MLEQAGATVSAQVTVQDAWVDTSDRSRRDDVAKDLTGRLSTAPGTDAGTDDLLAAELAQALVTPELAQTAQPDEGAAAVLAALADAGLVEVEGGTATPLPRGTLALLVAGAADSDVSDAQLAAQNAAWTALARELDTASAGAVLAGPAEAAADGGALAALRADSDVSRAVSGVDDLDSPVGRVDVVLALREQLSGGAGQYGTAGSAGAVIPPLPAAPQ